MREPENKNYKPIIQSFIDLLPKCKKLQRDGIENLPQAITFPPMQPLGEASKEASEKEEEMQYFGEIAKAYQNRPDLDTTFGIREEEGLYYIGNKQATIAYNNIIIGDEKFEGTPGLWELITSKNPKVANDEDYENYAQLMIKTNALHRYYDPNNPRPTSSVSKKWALIRDIWDNRRKYEGKGVVVVIPSDPNALLERLDLLLASKKAGHTGVGNKLVGICDELNRQGVLNSKSLKI